MAVEGGRSYQGGGKFRKKPFKRAQTTPYDRPIKLNNNNNSWVSKMIVEPTSKLITATAHLFFSSVRHRILPPPSSGANQELRDRIQETVRHSPVRDQGQLVNGSGKQCLSEGQELNVKDSGKMITDSTGLSELELMLKQKTFTRSEIDRLTTLLHSRTVESSNGNGENNTEWHPQEPVSSLRGLDDNMSSLRETRNGTPLDSCLGKFSHHGHVSTAVVSSKVLEEDGVSPAELAKAYMGNRSSKVSPAVSGLHSQGTREDSGTLCDSPFSARPSAISLVPNPSVQGGILENGFATPRPRGRSAMYNMARTPYSRVHSNVSNKGNSYNGSGGPSSSSSTGFARELVARSVSKDLALKRRSSVLDEEIGSVGPIRRLRQKTNLSTPNNTSLTSARTPYSSRGNGIVPNGAEDPSACSKTLQRSELIENMPGTSHTPVPSQSKEVARKILHQLQNLTPKEKQFEGKVCALSENLPTKLTSNMLHGQALRSLENVDSSLDVQGAGYSVKFTQKDPLPGACETSSQREDKVEENGPKSFNASRKSLAPSVTSNGTVLSKDTVPAYRFSEPVKKQPVILSSPKKRGFQMSAHEDFLDLDDEIHSGEDVASAKITKGKNILETPVVDSKPAPVIEDKKTPVSEVKAPTDSSVFAKPADLKTSDGTKLVEKISGFMFSSAPAASTSSWPGVPVPQSTTFAEKAPDEEPNMPLLSSSGAKTDDKVVPITFSSSSFAGGSVGLKSPPPEEVKQEYTKSSLAANASDTTETRPRPSVPHDNGINSMQKPEDTFGRPESLSFLPQSTSPFTVDSNNFGSLSNGSLSSTTPFSFSVPLPVIQTSNLEKQTLSNSFTAIPFLAKNNSNASSEATPSTSTTATATATATSSSFLAPGFKFESTFNSTPSTTVSPTPPLTAAPDFKVSSFIAPSTYSTVSTTSCATDVKTSTEKQALPSNPFSAMSSIMASTGSSVFGFNAGSTSSSGSASLSQGSSLSPSNITAVNTQSMPAFGLSATSSSLGTSGSTPVFTGSSVFGNTTSNSSSFGSNSISSSSFFSSSTSSSSTFGLSTTSKDSNTTPSSNVLSFGAQSAPSSVFGTSTGASAPSSVFSFSSAPQTQPMFGNTAVPAFGSAFGSVPGGNQMTIAEDSMAEDLVGPTPSVPVFGQQPVSNPTPSLFMFGSTPPTSLSGVVPFQFGGQPFGGQPVQQTPNPFQSSGNGLNFGGGGDGSFSLGSGGGEDRSTRRIIRVKHKNRGKR